MEFMEKTQSVPFHLVSFLGAVLNINSHRFRIIDVDLYVYRYMQDHPELFTTEVTQNVLKHLLMEGNLKDEIRVKLILQTS